MGVAGRAELTRVGWFWGRGQGGGAAWGRGYRAWGRVEAGPRWWHKARGGASVQRGGRRPAGWLAGPHLCGERALRPVEGYGRFSGSRWRRRRCGSCPLLQGVWLRLRLGTGDQNALGGADAAAPGFSGTAAPSPRVRGPRWRLQLFPGPAWRGGRRRCPAFRERGGGGRTLVGARGGAATPGRTVRCLSPAGALSGLGGRTRLALRFLPSEAQPRDGRMTPAGSPGSQSRGGCSCAVRHRRCPHPGPDPGAGRRLGFSSLPPTLACSPRPLSSSFGRVWPRPTPTHPGHLSRPSLSLTCLPTHLCLPVLCRVTGSSAGGLIPLHSFLPGLS